MAPHFLHELQTTFANRGGHPALVHRGGEYSYAELERRARRAATLLQGLGMQPGDRVLLATPSRLPFLIAHLGVLFGGGVCVPLNPRFTADELRHFAADSGARLAVVGAEQRPLFESLEGLTVASDDGVAEAPEAAMREPTLDALDPCLMIYSSGTTGWPKGVVHVNANLSSALGALGACWRFTPDDAVVNVLPLFHVHGLCFATLLTLLCGACVRLEDAFHPLHTLDAIDSGTVFMAVPTIYYRFLEQPTFRDKARCWSSVRLFTCGSAPIRPEVLPGLEEILGKPVINRYGMTEAHVITSLPLSGPWPTGSVGLPLDGIELKVTGPPGEPGAVLVRGPNLFREYWRNPEATRQAFAAHDGWFDTGDLGYLDERGFLTLVGRSNDLIISAGYNVYPPVVERVVNACPGVRESAVVGAADRIRGERVVVFVVRDDSAAGLDEARLLAFCAERLVDYQRPQQAFFVEALPRNAMGKVLRKELAKLAGGSEA